MNKYYTPDIGEFCIGFNYEFKHSDYPDMKWKKYSTPVFNHELEDWVFGNPTQFRVKCLNQKDIKSLGFELYKGHKYEKENQVILFSKNNLTLGHSVRDNLITIFITDPTKEGGFPRFIADSVKCTKLKIKNKFELKRLLTQLNIK